MKLLVITPNCPSDHKRLHLDGTGYGLQEYILEGSPTAPASQTPADPFICVSYSWGLGRIRSPFHQSFPISDRTIPVLAVTITQRPSANKIWVDAFCVPGPSQPLERAATLERMGFIYSRAEEVIAVLTSSSLLVLEQMVTTPEAKLSSSHLDILESEDWPIRAWTYQEAVNAKRLRIICDGAPSGIIIDCLQFFSFLGHALKELSPEDRKKKYPRLDAFEDVMADCAVAFLMERSALQVMSVMDGRISTWEDDHFYAMMGAISTEPASYPPTGDGNAGVVCPCESFMRLCETKGDYSFILSGAPRDPRRGYRWRPLPVEGITADKQLPAIIRLHNNGLDLRGRFSEETGLALENVVVLHPAPAREEVRPFLIRWLDGYHHTESESKITYMGRGAEEAAYSALRELGFTGSPEYISAGDGIFFPQTKIPEETAGNVEILVAAGIRWSLGSPGLARYYKQDEKGPYYAPGLLFGQLGDPSRPETVMFY